MNIFKGDMLLSALLLTIIVPVSANLSELDKLDLKPFVAQAVIDSARIIGLPPSKAAKAYANRIQIPDPIMKQITYTADPVSDRKLFFRNYFK